MAVVISDRLLESSERLLDGAPDEHLVRLAQTGHEAAFAAIVRRYERELSAQARRLTSDGRGEDVVQQAFLNAFTALRGGSEIRHLRGWLHQILRHEITRARVPVDAPLEAATAYGEPLEDTVQRRATAHETLVELSVLPERQRDALLGTAVLGFPRAHVARTMGVTEGAVGQLVHRARLRLRQAASALIPFPLFKLFGAAGSGVEAAPDAAIGAGTAASGTLVIKVGALLASGVVAIGMAVTRALPSPHHPAPLAARGHHHGTHPRPARASAPELPTTAPPATAIASDPAAVTSSFRLREHRAAGARQDQRSNEGQGRLSARSGRHGGPSPGRGRGHGSPGSPAGGDHRPAGSGRDTGGTATGGGPRGGPDSGSGSGSDSGGGTATRDGGGGGASGGGSGNDGGSGQSGDPSALGTAGGGVTAQAAASGSGSDGRTENSGG